MKWGLDLCQSLKCLRRWFKTMSTFFDFEWFTQREFEKGKVSWDELVMRSNHNFVVKFRRSTHNEDGTYKGNLPYPIGLDLNIHYLESDKWLTFDEIYTRHIQPEICPDMPPISRYPPEPFYMLRSLIDLIMVGYVEIKVLEC